VLIENKSLARIAERHRSKVERIRTWLTHTLTHGALPAVDRAQAGDALAAIGDPRFRSNAWHLPDERLLGFVEIPPGPFLMGSDKSSGLSYEDEMPRHEISLPRYYIARYLVTRAQFRAFVEESGYKVADEGSLRGLTNHPVVWVTWHEALSYCEWLTERLQSWEGTPEPLATLMRQEGWRISLPTEAQWEKAARGSDGRIYPWGDQFDPAKANTGATGIGTTSAVGCFPTGASLFGVLDASGNVWEWTRSLWGDDFHRPTFENPYNPTDGRENLGAPDHTLRVLRGGAFLNVGRGARCAFRGRNSADYRCRDIGFRIVVLPGL
jgi:formylglycine-generating enzyme required for sulfatase activity